MNTLDRLSKLRAHMLLDDPFYGSQAMRLNIKRDDSVQTAAVDGTNLFYCESFIDGLTDAELKGLIAHEVSHCALGHLWRMNGRDSEEWNKACDYVVNDLLVNRGYTLPSGALLDAQYSGMAAERVYAMRARNGKKQQGQQGQQQQQNGQQQGQGQGQGPQGQQGQQGAPKQGPQGQQQGQGQGPNSAPANGQGQGQGQQSAPCPTGTMLPPLQPDNGPQGQQSAPVMTEGDWIIATEQAANIAKKAGRMDGNTLRAVRATHAAETDWRAILRAFIEHTVPFDYSWTTPNRRYISAGVYLPGTYKENAPVMVVGIDTSGSIGQDELNIFARELTAILHETRPEYLKVVYCDTRVNHVDTFTPDDPEVVLQAYGGGGTRFAPVFDWVSDNSLDPACLLYFTDLEGPMPSAPEYPVLWITTESTEQRAAFGETVRLSEWRQ